MAKKKTRKPGFTWRCQAFSADGKDKVELTDQGGTWGFDELVIDGWIHLEQMDGDVWWMRLGKRRFWITVGTDGKAKKIKEEKE